MKVIKFIVVLLYLFSLLLPTNICQPPLTDNQYRQANVPPIVAVIIDVPSYGNTELFKWNDFVQANTKKIYENKIRNTDSVNISYNDRLKRMGMLKAKIR